MIKNKKNKEQAEHAERLLEKGHYAFTMREYERIIRTYPPHSYAPIVQTMKKKQAEILLQLEEKRQQVYKNFAREFGFDIPTQSRENLARQKQQLALGSYLPPNEQIAEHSFLTAREMTLWATWKSLCSDFSLFHNSEDLPLIKKDGFLRSLANRANAKFVVNNVHTGGKSARRNQIYCLLYLGKKHQAAPFLRGVRSYVRFDIGKMLSSSQEQFFKGLWVGSHTHEYYKSTKINQDFGATKRIVSYDKETMSKTVTYFREKGEKICIADAYKDEIFSAEDRLDDIFQGLFNTFILELRCLGDSFREYVLANANHLEIISGVYNHLFRSSIYPEASIIDSVDLQQPHVHYCERDLYYFYETYMMHAAGRAGCITMLKKLHELGISYDSVNSELEMTIAAVADKVSRYDPDEKLLINTMRFLLDQGVDIAARNNISYSLLTIALNAQCKPLIELILSGSKDPNLPIITYISVASDAEALNKAVQIGDLKILEQLFAHGAQISPDTIHAVRDENILRFLIDKGLDINRGKEKLTPLMAALRDKKLTHFYLLLKFKPNLSITDFEGKSILHYAALYANKEEILALIEKGAEKNRKDIFGNTPSDLIHCVLQNSSDEECRLRSNLKLLQDHGGVLSGVLSQKQQCEGSQLAAVALVIASDNDGDDCYILMIRKADDHGNPKGFYMFPGGLHDFKDDDFEMTAMRETWEETGCRLDQGAQKQIVVYEDVEAQTYYRTEFFLFDRKTKDSMPVMGLEIAECVWAKWSDIIITKKNGYQYMTYKGIPIRRSNGLILSLVMNDAPIAKEDITLQLRFEIYEGQNLMAQAIEDRDTCAISKLLQQGLDLSAYFYLTDACTKGLKFCVEFLLQHGANVNELSKKGSPVYAALSNGHVELAKFLIEECGADINQGVAESFPLIFACVGEDELLIDYLFSKDARVEQNIGGSALIVAIVANNAVMVRRLVQMDIDLNRKYPRYIMGCFVWNVEYPLELAVAQCSVEIVKILLNYGASVYCKNEFCLLEQVCCRIKQINDTEAFVAECHRNPSNVSLFFKPESLPDYLHPKHKPKLLEILKLLSERASKEVEGTPIFDLIVKDQNRARPQCNLWGQRVR